MARTDTYTIIFRTQGTTRVARDIRTIGREASATRRALSFLRSFLVVFASVRIFSGIFTLADAFTNLSNRLSVLSKDAGVIQSIRNEVFDLANSVRLPVEDLNESFVRISRSTLGLGLNFKELLRITESVGKAVQLSGASAQEAAGGLRQLSQGLASGALQGEELRSVAENLPKVADLIAKEFIPELRESGLLVGEQTEGLGGLLIALNKWRKGLLVTSRVVKPFLKDTEDIDEAFARLRPTIEQAFTVFRNKVIEFAGNLNQSTGIANSLAEGIIALAEHVDKLIIGFTAFVGAFALNLIISQVISLGVHLLNIVLVFSRLGQAAGIALGFLTKTSTLLGGFIVGAGAILGIVAAWNKWGDAIKQTIVDMGGLQNIFVIVVAAILASIQLIQDDWKLVVQALPALMARAFVKILEIVKIGVLSIANSFSELLPNIVKAAAQAVIGIGAAVSLAAQGEFTKAGEILAGSFSNAVEIAIPDLEKLKQGILDLTAFFANTGEAADELGKRFESELAQKITVVNEALASLQRPGTDLEDLLERPTGSADEVAKGIAALTSEQEKLRDALKSLVAAVSPVQDRMFQLAEAVETYEEALEKLPASLVKSILGHLTWDEVLKRTDREISGVGNALTDYQETLRILNDQLLNNIITQEEFALATFKAEQELKSEAQSLLESVSPLAAATRELTEAQLQLNAASRMGIQLGLSNEQIIRRTEREIVGAGNAASIYEEKIELLNRALQNASISQEEFIRLTRQARIEFLDEQRTLQAGIERSLLKMEDAYSDTATNIENAFGSMFQTLEDQLVEFVQTGIFNFQTLIDTIIAEISRVFIREGIGELIGIFNDIFGTTVGQGGQDESAAKAAAANEKLAVESTRVAFNFASMNGSLVGVNGGLNTLTLSINALQLACEQATICLQNMCAVAGGAGGGSSLFSQAAFDVATLPFFGGGGPFSLEQQAAVDVATLPFFKHGGSFTVGPSSSPNLGGIDNRLVQFRAQDGEQVNVTPRGKSGRGATVIMNINTPDADSFKRNTTQISARMAGALSRADARLNK